jgi:uncharacterized repeat protein (TIGR03806 family)
MLKAVQVLFVFILMGTLTISLMVPPFPPSGPIAPYLNGIFPESSPGVSGSWALEDPFPNLGIGSPLRILEFPGSSDLLVLSKLGEVWRVSLENQEKELILDIKDRSFKKGEAGTVGMILHPDFGNPNAPDNQLIFLFYRTKPEPDEFTENGFNRLSKFTWDAQSDSFDPDSEEILIQHYDRSTWHNGGAMFFGPDGFLYLSLGDEGQDQFQSASTQQISGGLFSGIIRIDVDNDPSRSHPIRRQPQANALPPSGWGDTFTQGYSIPNDNPWLSPDSSILEEFYAIGIRSPFSMHYDSISQQIWLSDVGAGKREEISLVNMGDNLQWPYLEGTLEFEGNEKPEPLIGQEKGVYFEYDRSVGACIIGGGIYRGDVFPSLYDKFIFADYIGDKLMAITGTGSGSAIEFETLLSSLGGQGVVLPESPGITGVYFLKDGQILLTITGEDFTIPGKILKLKQNGIIPDPPSNLSELGVFTDLNNLTPVSGIIPYGVNTPLWSDRAIKKRWVAIPNDGEFDSNAERIDFESTKEWSFPEGTVFIKQFDLPITTDPGGETVPLETRFFIIGDQGIGYGLTYKWNDEGTDAVLLRGGSTKDFDITEGGATLYTQTWDYPSRNNCMTCHTENANYVLGMKTHQMNGDLYYPELGRSMNQLEYFNQLGIFRQSIKSPGTYKKSFPIGDGSVDLEVRIRSYLDANCSSCHRVGGVPMVNLDFRFVVPVKLHNSINFSTQSQASDPNRLIIKTGDHASSELWIRDSSIEDNRMPPIGRNLVDEVYVDSLAKWIDNLSEDEHTINELYLYPNPSSGWLTIRISDNWLPPFRIKVYSTDGKILNEQTAQTNSVYLDLTKYPAGTYFMEVSAAGEKQIGKFILH